MVADWQVLPVGHQSVLLPPEHGAHVGGVVQRRVEVRVVPDGGGQVHPHPRLRHEGARPERGVVPQHRVVARQQCADRGARLGPVLRAQPHESVERVAAERGLVGGHERAGEEMRHGGQVQHLLPDGDPDPGAGLLLGAEHSIGEVLEGEGGVARNVDPSVVHGGRLGTVLALCWQRVAAPGPAAADQFDNILT